MPKIATVYLISHTHTEIAPLAVKGGRVARPLPPRGLGCAGLV
jgi:hypothetical protein